MKVAILNGEPSAGSAFDTYVHEVAERMRASGHEVLTLELRDLAIKGCSGCWGCWVKTPGECVNRDDSEHVCRAATHSDLVVLASPMVLGFTSALLKRVADQMIPLVHPYLVIEGGEMHHLARYRHRFRMGLLLGASPDTDVEDLEITEKMWSRMARNLKSRLVFTAVTDRPAREVAHELTTAA